MREQKEQTELVPVILLDIHFKNVPELFYKKKGKGTPVKRPVLFGTRSSTERISQARILEQPETNISI